MTFASERSELRKETAAGISRAKSAGLQHFRHENEHAKTHHSRQKEERPYLRFRRFSRVDDFGEVLEGVGQDGLISGSTGPTEVVHLSKFAGFNQENNYNTLYTLCLG